MRTLISNLAGPRGSCSSSRDTSTGQGRGHGQTTGASLVVRPTGGREPKTTPVDGQADQELALAALLPLEGDITVLAEAEDGDEAVETTLTHRPDVLVIDLETPGMDGLAAVGKIRQVLPDQVILMLTRHARPGVLRNALKLGIQGFASKSAEPSHIASVVTALHAGGRWIDQDVSAAAIVDDNPGGLGPDHHPRRDRADPCDPC